MNYVINTVSGINKTYQNDARSFVQGFSSTITNQTVGYYHPNITKITIDHVKAKSADDSSNRIYPKKIDASTPSQQAHNVKMTSYKVASTLIRRHFDVVCLLGYNTCPKL